MNLFNLIGKLTLDTSSYEKGIEDAKGANKEFEESSENTTAAAAAAWSAVVAVLLKVISKVKELIVDSTEYADNIKNMAQIYGYSIKEIQEMMSVAEQSGKSIERVLRAIQSSGETAAEYLGLSAKEYEEMVNDAYRFGTILSDEAVNAIDAFGDRIAYLKAEWKAAIASLLAGEDGAEAAVEQYFENVKNAVEQYAPSIIRFFINLVVVTQRSIIEMLPVLIEELITATLVEFWTINWFKVGFDLIKAVLKGVWHGLGKLGRKIFGLDDSDASQFGVGVEYASLSNIGSTDYKVNETVTQKIDVNLKYDGDTPIGEHNAELVSSALAQQIDEILGRRLNG